MILITKSQIVISASIGVIASTQWDAEGIRFTIVDNNENVSNVPIAYDSNKINAVIQTQSGRILAGGYMPDAAYNPLERVIYSDDGGDNWTTVPLSELSFDPMGLAQNSSGRIVTAGGEYEYTSNRMAYSDDDGETWTELAVTSGSKGIVSRVRCINDIFYACGNFTSPLGKIIKSSDGINWSSVGGANFTSYATDITLNGNRLIATGSGGNNIMYSDDNGDSWTGAGTGSLGLGYGIISDGTGNVIACGLAGGSSSLSYSTDSGETWNGLGNGFGSYVYEIVYSEINGKFYAATSGSGIIKNDDLTLLNWSTITGTSTASSYLGITLYSSS